jgi:hypothetical protein
MSSRPTLSSWQGCMVSTVNSYRPPVTTACKPRISPSSAIRIRKVLPSRELAESLACPWQRIKIPHGLCPSTRTTACSGKPRHVLSCGTLQWTPGRDRRKHCGNADGNSDSFQRSSIRTHSLALLHLPQKHVCAGFGGKRLSSSKYSSLASRQDCPHAEGDDRRFARRLPFDFWSDTQCLQHSSHPQRPRLAAGLARLPSVGRSGSGAT